MRKTGGLFSLLFFCCIIFYVPVLAQHGGTHWSKDGLHILEAHEGQIIETDVRNPEQQRVLLSREALTPEGRSNALDIRRFSFSDDNQKVLINTNTRKVWRYDTRGDYWVYDLSAKTLKQLGKGRPESSLMFAKFSADASKVAYVSRHNIYVEDLASGKIDQLTDDGTDRLINGTFDWAYEEEFDCRDGFRWSPDGKSIAYWQIDARKIRNYLMLNTTDSAYSFNVPVEYPKAGTDPSACRIGVVDISSAKTRWMDIPGDAVQHYITRMEWALSGDEIILEQLNRAQTESRIMICDTRKGSAKTIHTETDKAWIDGKSRWNDGDPAGWEWLEKGKAFLWVSEKDGWRHIYRVDRNGREKLLTPGDYDVITINLIDENGGDIYFMASPENATQKYLYKVKLSGGKAERVTPAAEKGVHDYDISPTGSVAFHSWSSSAQMPAQNVVMLPAHKTVEGSQQTMSLRAAPKVEFFQVKTADGVTLDGWMVKPKNFNPKKKYPIVFYVYGEPAGQTVTDSWGVGYNRLYTGSMYDDGYIYCSLENRGAPAPKGREWRRAIYKNIGRVNIRDQAMGAKELLKNSWIDTARVAVWGWSGGGSSTLNLLFQYPEIYKTGIAIAAVGNQLSYDNIYQERYMGVPTTEEGKEPFIKGSPVTYAENLRGNLLYIHGTGDDNVHYQNAELLINALIKHNRQFEMMAYPNRTHSISEGEGTSKHLATLYTRYLRAHCPPGAK
ncbi:MAG: S9 family peptidase [Mucilaginibacter polytrichastri]|nr:S9 family peptidase [Mucilaginibacter polytrichastri]